MRRTSGFSAARALTVLWPLLASIFITGCVAPQVTVPPGAQPEKYRKVYLYPSQGDPRNVTPRVAERLKRAGFNVTTLGTNSEPVDAQGTGFVITTNGHVVTCAHVVAQQTNATIWIDGKRHLCQVLSTDTNIDTALLLVKDAHEPFRPLPFAAVTNYAMGQDVFTMGFPLAEVLGTAPRLNKGMVSATVGLDDDKKYLQFSAPVQPGNSGGPLLNPRGEIVGLVSATLNPGKVFVQTGGALPQNVNFAVKSTIIRDFLATNGITLPAPPAETPAEVFEVAKLSVGLIHPGIVTDEELKQPTLVCAFGYFSIFDYYWRFRHLEIALVDLRKGDLVMKVGQYQDDLSSEDAELDKLFGEICERFFPNQPNPFKSKKKSAPAPSGGKSAELIQSGAKWAVIAGALK